MATLNIAYRDEAFYIPALFFADNVLLMANSQKQAEQLLDVMRNAAGRRGLEMDAMKSKCLIFNYRGAPIELLKGMEVVERLRYLGVTVVNKQNCFLQHQKEKIMQARKMANLTYSIIARSCSKILIGKTY